MAFATTETYCFDISAGTTSLKLLIGTFTNTSGSTGGVISPGTPSSGSAVTGSSGIKQILFNFYESTSSSPSAIQSVVAYDSTDDRDELTITTAANQTGRYAILGIDSSTPARTE
jgi:hypothetical protein